MALKENFHNKGTSIKRFPILAMKCPPFGNTNRRESGPKFAIVSGNIGAGPKQNQHMTYVQTEATLGIPSSTNIYKMFQRFLLVGFHMIYK